MEFNGITVYFCMLILFLILSWGLIHDNVSCVVHNAGSKYINGYYAAIGGMYIKRGHIIEYVPDFFKMYSMYNEFSRSNSLITISLHERSWQIFELPHKRVVYKNVPKNPEKYIFSPPETDWKPSEFGLYPSPEVFNCVGSLADSPSLKQGHQSNIEELMSRPVTTALLAIIFGVAYYLWSKRIPASDVCFSYETVVQQGEVWRAFTASLSHYDLMHLGFNCMTLYQIGSLEPLWGSVAFAYLNIGLIVITIAICTGVTHCMVHYYGRPDLAAQRALGFSCVLFAWMVAQSVRMQSFCPIFLFPALCFTTYAIPLPGFDIALPVNLGPIVLLFVTKIIIPNSSFLGHLSGIIIGYPLAWNAIDWLTPPMLSAILALISLYLCDLTSVGSRYRDNQLPEGLPAAQFLWHRTLLASVVVLCLLLPVNSYVSGVTDCLPRVTMCLLLWLAYSARKCEWLSDSKALQLKCCSVLLITAAVAAVASICDAASGTSVLAAWDMLCESGGLSAAKLWAAVSLLWVCCFAELTAVISLVRCLHSMPEAAPWLKVARIDSEAVQRTLTSLGWGFASTATPAFGGTGRSLRGATRPSTPLIL